MKKKLLSFLGAVFIAHISFSQTISETFNYADGANLINSNSKWSSPLGSGNSLTIINESFVKIGDVNTKSVRLSGSSSSEQSEFSTTDLNGGRVFRDTEGEVLYVALGVNVTSAPTGDEYFANVSGGLNGAGTVVNARGRMYVKNIDGKLAFGVSWGASGTAAPQYTSGIYDFYKSYIIVLKFIGSNKTAQLFVFDGNLPAVEPAASTLSATSTEGYINGQGFVIRHTSTSQNILVGGIIASTSWPTGMAITKATLPIELKDFKATAENGVVKLNWSTSSERNNNYFEVLKSTDGTNFNVLGTVAGNQNSSANREYSFIDRSHSTGTVYYKLKQFDNDGRSEEFGPIALKISELNKDHIQLFKNSDGLVQAIFDADKGDVIASLYTVDGKKVSEVILNVQESGTQTLTFSNISSSGVYIVNIKYSNKSVTKKVIFSKS